MLPNLALNGTVRIQAPGLIIDRTALADPPLRPEEHLGVSELSGSYLENLLLRDLNAWRDAGEPRAGILFRRTHSGEEQVSVNGLTLGQLENRLYDRLGRVYSGVERGPEATTHVSVSLGRLRTKQVYLIGDVENPSAYQVSPVSRMFNALYNAGGPSTRGSLRIIQVRRSGNVIGEIDVYDYLLRGEAQNDIRLEQGDIVFVPMAGPRVSVLGQVRRQAIFELREAEEAEEAE